MKDNPLFPPGDPVRVRLHGLIAERRDEYAALSRLLSRNAAYIQQYLHRGTPRRLPERERAILADYFGIEETELGAAPSRTSAVAAINRAAGAMRLVPRLDVGAAAGAGGLNDGDPALPPFAFDAGWLRRVSAEPGALAIIRVEGDSMTPTLIHGDDIMVDSADGATRLRDGIYVLRRDGMLLVKRLARGAGSRTVTIISDNGAYPREDGVSLRGLDIVGRVVWAGRQIS